MSGNVNDICPVGALCSTDFLYKQRAWFLEPHDSVCTRCSTGCSIQLHVNQNQLYRIQPRYNPNVNDWWMCDIGRNENQFVHASERIGSIKQRAGEKFQDLLWPEGLKAVHDANDLGLAVPEPSRLAFVLSPFLALRGVSSGRVHGHLA